MRKPLLLLLFFMLALSPLACDDDPSDPEGDFDTTNLDSSDTNNDSEVVETQLQILAVAPNAGPLAGGTAVVISGSAFTANPHRHFWRR